MLNLNRLSVSLMVLLSVIFLAACGGGGETPIPTTVADSLNPVNAVTPSPESAVLATAAPTVAVSMVGLPVDDAGNALIARVNGKGITQTVFERALARSQQLGFAADTQALAQTILDTLIEQAVIEQAAADLGIVVTDDEIDADIAGMEVAAGSVDAWTQWKRDNLYTDDEYREATRSQLITLRVRDLVTKPPTPEPGSTSGQSVHARHILVATDAEAQLVLQRLRNGESFEAVAADSSLDMTTRDRGGDLGFFVAEDLTTPELAEAAFKLRPGEITGPVATMLGYHIIQTIEFGTAANSPEEQARQQEAAFNLWLEGQMAAASIERYMN